MSSQLGEERTIGAFSSKDVRMLFDKLEDAMRRLSKQVGDKTGESAASRILKEKMRASYNEGELSGMASPRKRTRIDLGP